MGIPPEKCCHDVQMCWECIQNASKAHVDVIVHRNRLKKRFERLEAHVLGLIETCNAQLAHDEGGVLDHPGEVWGHVRRKLREALSDPDKREQ